MSTARQALILSFASLLGCGGSNNADFSRSVVPVDGGCSPTTCQALAKSCGNLPDGCGGTLSCGDCAAPETCGGGGVSNVCGGSKASAPAAPAGLVTYSGNGFVLMHWVAPITDGGSPILGYVATATPAQGGNPVAVESSDETAIVNGLANGISYSFTVRARNAVGIGDPAAAVSGMAKAHCDDRTFAPLRSLKVGKSPSAVAAADLRGTGWNDIVVANQDAGLGSSTVGVLLNDGDGNFDAEVEYPIADGPMTLVAGDFDGDGKTDLLAGGSKETLLFNNGEGIFGSRVDFGTVAESLSPGDFNEDGLLDVALADQGFNSAVTFLNRGSGTFSDARHFGQNFRPYAVAAGDLNHDGHLDLAVKDESTVQVLVGDGAGSFTIEQTLALDEKSGVSLVLGEFVEKGDLDIAVGNEDVLGKKLTILENRGDIFVPTTIPAGIAPFHLATADIDRDGRPDLAYTDESSSFAVLLNRGDGMFAEPMIFNAGHFPVSIALADVNGDSFPDALIADFDDNAVSVFLNVCRP